MIFSKIIKKKFDAVWGRYEENPAKYYFSLGDFAGLKREVYGVTNSRGVKLAGYFYYYGEMRTDRIIIFDHGIEAGHRKYLNEINMLAKHGYTVYSYDHMGCADSEGIGITGFAQGVCDLDSVIAALKTDEKFKAAKFSIVGHSWGGYSAMNVVAIHKDITHVVSLAGFLSARSLIEQYLPKFVLKYSDEVMGYERANNPQYADMNACESLMKSDAKLLYLQSKDDSMVRYDMAYEPLAKALADRPDTELWKFENKDHLPHLTDAAVSASVQLKAELNALEKKKKLRTKEEQEAFKKAHNWKTLTEQDTEVWNKIFDFLDK